MPTFLRSNIAPAAAKWPAAASASILSLTLVGCASISSQSAATAPAASGVDQRAEAPAALVTERRWLQSWFDGTPVVIGQARDTAVTVDVPREFSFDTGRSNIKPPLAAVLDKVAESMRRVDSVGMPLLAAPADPGGKPQLALDRAGKVRQYLVFRGVPSTRLGKTTATTANAVQMRLEAAPL